MLKARVLIPDAPFCSVIPSVSFLLNSILSGLLAHLLLELVPPTPELGEALRTCSVPKAVLGVQVFSRHGLFWVCCCDLVLVGCAGV